MSWGSSIPCVLDPSVTELKTIDHKALFEIHREATVKVLKKALANEPSIDWLLENQHTVEHFFHQLGVEGKLD